MANITSVTVHHHKNGVVSVVVNYRNSYTRDFPYLPKSADKFLDTAKVVKRHEYRNTFATTYSN